MREDLNVEKGCLYVFEGFTLDSAKRLVIDADGSPLPLMPKAFDILIYLVVNSQRVVEKDELMSAIWPDTIVEENNLTQNISALRRVLGEKHRENRFIATVPGRGYKFVADVVEAPQRSETALPTTGLSQVDIGPESNSTDSAHRPKWLFGLTALVLFGLISLGFAFWNGWPATPSKIRSMAVLPFKPLASDRRDESIELGMADTLIMKLGSDEEVSVRPLSAVRRFASLDQDPIEAGRAVNVDAVLAGNIQTANDRIRVTVQLLRVSDSKQLWSGQFDEKLTDIFDVQNSIAQRVATALNLTLGKASKKPLTESVEAYQLYMRGNLHTRRLVRAEVEKGITYYQEALKLDPRFALAYTELAYAYRALVLTSDQRPSDYMPKAKEAALNAIEVDDTLAEAWVARAITDFWFDWDARSAEANHLRALELDPQNAQAHLFYAHLLSNLGRHDEALKQVRFARERDPASLITNAVEGQVLFFAGQDDAAEKVLNQTIDLEPNFWLAYLFISRVHLRKGEYDRVIASSLRAAELSGGSAEAFSTAAFAYARSGRPDEARKILADLQERSKSRYVPSYTLAQIYCGLGETGAALDYLEKAFEERDALMVFLKLEPKWDSLRSEPRFVELLRRMNFE